MYGQFTAVLALLVTFPGPLAVPSPAPAPPRYDDEWALTALHASDMWAWGAGRNIKVAVVDTGIDALHPDLAGAVGYPSPARQDDGSADSHGTEVAGLIAGRGSVTSPAVVAGLAPQAELLDIRVTDNENHVTAAEIVNGIDAAVRAGAQIINVSLSVPLKPGDPWIAKIQQAVDDAPGCLIVASVNPLVQGGQYPAGASGVLAVAPTGQQMAPAGPLTGYAPNAVYAPGENLYSTVRPGKHGDYRGGLNGGGLAAAYVSAAAAAIWSGDVNLSSGQLENLLATDVSAATVTQPVIGVLDPLAVVTALRQATSRSGTRSSAASAQRGAGQAGGSSAHAALLSGLGIVAAVAVGLVVLVIVVVWVIDARDGQLSPRRRRHRGRRGRRGRRVRGARVALDRDLEPR